MDKLNHIILKYEYYDVQKLIIEKDKCNTVLNILNKQFKDKEFEFSKRDIYQVYRDNCSLSISYLIDFSLSFIEMNVNFVRLDYAMCKSILSSIIDLVNDYTFLSFRQLTWLIRSHAIFIQFIICGNYELHLIKEDI